MLGRRRCLHVSTTFPNTKRRATLPDPAFQQRNRHFNALCSDPDLMWMGQNTNHFAVHPAVKQALLDAVEREEFHTYAPPAGFTELQALILDDLGLTDANAWVLVTDGAIEGLYHVCSALARPGERFIGTDPGWKWPANFARAAGAEIIELPIYEASQGYRLTAQQLRDAASGGARIIYLIDPLNPLGIAYTETEIESFCAIAREAGAYLIHDCTYRHFADAHSLAARFYPERTITTYSFSKWLGLAGLRVGALVASDALMERLVQAQPNNLGSNVLSQRAAIAGLKVKEEWLPEVRRRQRQHQALIRDAALQLPGLSVPVYPSQGNFMVIDCAGARITPEALCAAYLEEHILIRQAAYQSRRYAERFVKVSTTVPTAWVERFCELLPEMVQRAVAMGNQQTQLY